MGYYGVSVYRGDYYGQRGDYYRNVRGDPGFFDFLSDVGSAIVSPLSKIPVVGEKLFGAQGMLTGLGVATGQMTPAQALGKILSPGAPIPTPPNLSVFKPPPIWAAAAPGTGSTVAMIPKSPTAFINPTLGGGYYPGAAPAFMPKTPMPGGSVPATSRVPMLRRITGGHHRRMNALNPRALSRALRRANSFKKYATKVLKLVGEKRHVAGFKHRRKKR